MNLETNVAGPDEENPWKDDVLDRKRYADYLTRYLDSRSAPHELPMKPFTLALDAEWGLGKTFFVSRWAQDLASAEPKRLSFVFNAWEADYGTDALLAFIAAFKRALEIELKVGSPGEALGTKIKTARDDMVKSVGRAIVPTGKFVLSRMISRFAGSGLEEISAVFKDASEDEDQGQSAGRPLDAAMDALFNHMLADEQGRSQLVQDFKGSVARYLEAIRDATNARLPMYVFIDELDRCRPSFAIELLEAIKHLFDIEGLCFVVSTNMNQLAESVKAVYGQGFSSRAYLRRFFDAEFSLPDPDAMAHVRLLLASRPELSAVDYCYGLPDGISIEGDSSEDPSGLNGALSTVIAWVFEVFSLDLRSQHQVMEVLTAAILGHGRKESVHVLWLAALCSLRHRDAGAFANILDSRDRDEVVESLRMLAAYKTITYSDRDPNDPWKKITGTVDFKDVFMTYWTSTAMTSKDLREWRRNSRNEAYPECLIGYVADEPSVIDGPHGGYSCLRRYPDLVKQAGYFAA